MIIEYFKYLTNPASKSAKQLGQLQESIAMEARHKRSLKQWKPHLENTKSLIEEACKNIQSPNDVIVLGSGLLLDVPIEFLSRYFTHVYLVDVVHLNTVKQTIKQYGNVTLIEHDVTGFSKLIEKADTKNNITTTPMASTPCLSTKTSMIISANMLSQLHLSPVRYATKKLGYSEKKQERLTLNIMQSHIKMLSDMPCKVCLITDYTRKYHTTGEQHVIEEEEALPGIKLPKPDKHWLWEIAPKGELGKNVSLTSEVYGYLDFN